MRSYRQAKCPDKAMERVTSDFQETLVTLSTDCPKRLDARNQITRNALREVHIMATHSKHTFHLQKLTKNVSFCE